MSDLALPASSETDNNDESIIAAYWAELMSLREQIDAEQMEINRLKAENRELKTETRAMLTTLKATVLS